VLKCCLGKLRYELEEVESSEDLRRELNLTAKAAAGFGPWKASGGVSLFRSVKHNQFTRTLVVRVDVLQAPAELTSIRLSPTGEQAVAGGANSFLFSCGTEFIVGQERGARMLGVVQIVSKSAQEARALKARFAGKLTGIFSSEAEMKSRLDLLRQQQSVRVVVEQDGGLAPVPSIEELETAVRAFSGKVAQGYAINTGWRTASYRQVSNPPRELAAVLRDASDAMARLEDLAELKVELDQRSRDLAFVQQHSEGFRLDGYAIADSITKSKSQAQRIIDLMNACVNQPSVCATRDSAAAQFVSMPAEVTRPAFEDVSVVINPKAGLQLVATVPEGVNALLSASGKWRYTGDQTVRRAVPGRGPFGTPMTEQQVIKTPYVGPEGHDRVIRGQLPAPQRGGMIVVEFRTLQDVPQTRFAYTPGAAMAVPPATKVYVMMNDDTGHYGDNENLPEDPMRVKVVRVP
jgi:hypothetical protein